MLNGDCREGALVPRHSVVMTGVSDETEEPG